MYMWYFGSLRMAECSNIVDEILVKVKRQDSSFTKEVRLSNEYSKFLKDNFPHFNERMVTVPVSFHILLFQVETQEYDYFEYWLTYFTLDGKTFDV